MSLSEADVERIKEHARKRLRHMQSLEEDKAPPVKAAGAKG